MQERRNIPLNTKDPDVHAMAKEIAGRTGLSLTAVVREALTERLARERNSRARTIERVMAIAAEISSSPVLDARTPDEIIGYDQFGVPR